MANVDAFLSGWDMGSKGDSKRPKQKKQPKDVKQITTSDGQTLTPLPLKGYHKGGKVKKTGPARLKKGEVVLTASQAKAVLRKGGNKKKGTHKRVSSKG